MELWLRSQTSIADPDPNSVGSEPFLPDPNTDPMLTGQIRAI
jgi:hypothetical protein